MLADSTNWIDIPVEEQKKIYVLKYVVNSTGTYYLWFKDSSGNVINKEITISDIFTDKPVCTWSNPGSSILKGGESTTITLTCIDSSSKIIDSDISISDISVSSTSIIVSDNIVKESNFCQDIVTLL